MENKKIAINASWILVGRFFQLALTFITTMLVSRYLGPSENGKMIYVYSYIQLFLPICALGLNDIAVKELVDDREHNNEILGSMIVMRLFVSTLSMICAVILVSLFNNKPGYTTIAILQSFALLFQSFDGIMYFYQSKMLSKKSGTVYALAYVISSIFRIIGIVLHKDVRWFAFAMSFDYIMIASLLLYVYYKDKNNLRFSFDRCRKLLSLSKHYIYAGLLVVIYGKVTDTLLLGKMIDETTVGYYGAATTLCNAWPFVLTAIIDSLSPVIIESHKTDKDEYEKKIKTLYALIFYISTLAAIMITLLSDIVITIAYGKAYQPASVPMKIYAWSTAFSYIGVARTSWMQCEGKTKYETVISLFGAFSSIVLNFILISRFGIVGAALAAVLTQFLTNFVFLFVLKETRNNAKLILDAILLKGVIEKQEKADV